MNPMPLLSEEFKHEAATTRRLLERLPEAEFGWAPHPKSMTLAHLASHLAEIPSWTAISLQKEGLDIDPTHYQPWIAGTREELLQKFDENVAASLKALGESDPACLGLPWAFSVMGQVAFQMPRGAVLRTMVFSHLIHHRGQLSVYIRLKDVPVPSIYGPSADEAVF